MFKRKLFKHAFSKRALPVILSVAMIFQSMPATAMAAEDAVAVEKSVEDSTDEQTATEAAEPASEQSDSEASNENASSEAEVSEETSNVTVSEEPVSTEETTDTEAVTEENNQKTDTSVEETSTPESSSNEETTTAESTEPEQTTQESTVEETEEMQEAGNEAEAGLVTNLDVNFSEVESELLSSGFNKVVDEEDPEQLKYAAPYGTDFSWIKETVKDNITIWVDEEDQTKSLSDYLQLKWLEIGAEGKISIPGLPDKVGKTYCLEVSNEAVKDLCQAAEPQEILFEITKAEITLDVDEAVKVKPGTKIADFISDLKTDYTLSKKSSNSEESSVDHAVVEKFNPYVYEVDSTTGKRGENSIADGVFDKKKNYIVEINIDLNEEVAQNYTIVQQDYYVITVGELQETEVLVEWTEPKKEIVRTYDAKTDIKLESVEELKSVKVQLVAADDETKTPIEVKEGDIKRVWYTREFLPSNITSSDPDKETQIDIRVEDGKYRYTRLPEGKNPKDAGEYYIIYVYSGDGAEAYYQGSNSASDAILVTIEPAPVIVIPDELALAEGMTSDEAKEALLQLTYNIYLEGTTTPVYTPKHDDFFGVWYDKNENEKIQYYQPTFKIWTRQEKKNPSSDTDKWEDWKPFSGSIRSKMDDGRAVEYQVRFTGEKCVYNANGEQQASTSATDITTNAAEKNYLVKIDSATLEKNVGAVKVSTPKETSIKTEAIVNAFKDKITGTGTLDDPLSKIYNEKPLYEKRDEYKQAVVEGATNTVAPTDDRLKYTWTRISLSKYDEYKKLTAEEKENLDIDDFLNWGNVSSDDSDDTIDAPVNAGVYKLHISYEDDSHNDLASSADLYYKIDQQEVMITSRQLKASYGEDISAFEGRYTGEYSYDDYVAYIIPENDTKNLPVEEEKQEKISVRGGQWHVQRPKKNDDGTDSEERIAPDETSFIDASYKYEAYMTWDNRDYNYTSINRKESTEEETKYHYEAAEIQFIGDKEIVFEVDAKLMPQNKTYDGAPIAEKMPEGLVKIKSKADNTDLTKDLLNLEDSSDNADNTDLTKEEGFSYNDKVTVEWKWDKNPDSDELTTTSKAVYGGKYTLYAHFSGNTAYAAYEEGKWVELTDENGNPYTFEIKPLEIDITPKLREKDDDNNDIITAGDEVWKLIWEDREHDPYYTINYDSAPESGKIPKKDKVLFEYYTNHRGNQGFPLFSDYGSITGDDLGEFTKTITDNATGKDVDINIDYLKYGNTYTVRYGEGKNKLGFPWSVSYKVNYKPATITVGKHSHATVSGNTDKYDASVIESLEEDTNTHIIIPRAMVKFADKEIPVVDNKASAGRNYIAFRINAPKELDSNWDNGKKIVYKTNIENAGGYLLRDWDSSKSIDVLFPVVKETDGTIKETSFAITWEKDFTETFKLNIPADRLEADLKNAVEPKSLAFNGVTTKMAVGSEQALDVKITKAQLGDIIKINYRLADGTTKNDNISIDPETGVVTALATTDGKPVTVQIEAYPVHRGSDGKIVPIENSKKIAKTKITVTEVTAPAIKRLTFSDHEVDVTLGAVTDGYRREIYVVKADAAEAKKMKMADFEPLIDKMANGQWKGTFAIKPKYVYDKTPAAPISLGDLDPDTSYAVYVRNVSAVRMLSDGSKVTLSKNGTVKAFTTTKSQVKGLDLYFNSEDAVNKDKLRDSEYDYETVLSAKNLQLSVDGIFDETYGHEAADEEDEIRFKLPLNTKEEQQKAYVNPKLTYAICDKYYNINNAFLKTLQSKCATINNKGKVTLKGVGLDGEATVYIYVKADNGKWNYCSLHIVTDAPDTITGKKAKIKVGDSIYLKDYLEYKSGKTKVLGFYSSGIEIVNWVEAEAAGYSISRNENNQYSIKCEAVKPEGKNFKLQIRDHRIAGDGATAEVTLTSAPIDPVKGLKVGYVDDKHITLNFTYAGHPESYDIEVRDARQNLILKTLVDANSWEEYTGYDSKGEKAAQQQEKARQQWIQTRVTVNGEQSHSFIYYTKTKTYAYTIADPKLIRLSAYNITVTPVYKDQIAKPAKTKTKTTNIPASTNNMDAMDAYYTSYGMLFKGYGEWEDIPRYFTAGNTYTLMANFNNDAQTRVTDTLTWKSSNTKVATIKANPGTYTATFKPLKSGTTIITVTSKITKKIIGRYLVEVKSVGSAGAIYGGDYEQTWSDEFYKDILAKYDPLYHGRLEVLTETQPLNVTGNERIWVSFTAPTFGEYTFEASSSWSVYNERNLEKNGVEVKYPYKETYFLEAGQTIYFKFGNWVSNFGVTSTEFAKLNAESNNSKDNALEVTRGEWVSFTAPEDNYYRFMDAQIEEVRKNNKSVFHDNEGIEFEGIGLKAGDTLLIKIKSGSALWVSKSDAATKLAKDKPVTVTLTKDNNVSYVYFAAPVTAKYTFTTKNADAEYIKADGAVVDTSPDTNKDGNVCELNLQKEETIAIKLTATDDKFTETSTENRAVNEISASVSVTVNEKSLTIDGTQKIAQGTTELVAVTLPKEAETAKYVFKVTDGSIGTVYNDALQEIKFIYGSTWSSTVNKDSEVKPGDTIYLEVTADENTTNEAAEAVISAAAVQNTTLTANTEDKLTLTNGFEKWYTFTAKTDGYYEINAEVTANENNGATHSVSISKYKELFGAIESYPNSITSGDFVWLETGASIVFNIKANGIGNNTDGTPITSKASVVVKPVKITPITLGIDAPVNIPEKGEPQYYSFTAPETGNYNLDWSLSTAKTAELRFNEAFVENKNDTMDNEWYGSTNELEAGKTYYFQAKPTSDAAVNGNIKVIAAPKTETLESDTPKSFSLEKDETRTYRFTAPNKEILGYAVTVEIPEKDGKKPEVTVTVNDDYTKTGSTLYMENYITNEKYSSSKISISTTADTAAGSITIIPITAAAWGADDVKATNLKPVYYQYPVEKAGRYQFTGKPADANTGSINLQGMVVAKDNKTIRTDWTSWTGLTTTYLKEGDIVYAKASTSATTEQGASIQKPVIIDKALTLDANNSAAITLPTGQTEDYYVFTAPAEAYYSFAGIGYSAKMYTPADKTGADDFDSNTLLNTGDQVLVTVYASGTLTVTQNQVTVLSIGADKKVSNITLEPNKSKNFSFKVYEKGIYSVKVEGTESSLNIDMLDENGSEISTNINNYLVAEYREPATAEFSISNNTTTATVSITVERLANPDLKLGADGNLISVPMNEIRLATFKVEETGRYRFTADNDKVQISDRDRDIPVDNSEVPLSKGREITFIFTGDKEAAQTVKFTVNIVTPTLITEPTLKVPANTSEWFAYEAKKAAWYTFELKDGETAQSFDLYNSMVDSSPINTRKIWLNEKDTIILKVSNGAQEDKNYAFAATTEEAADSAKLTFSRLYEYQRINFEASKTGIYKVTGCTKDSGAYFYISIYKNGSYENGFSVSGTVSRELVLNQGDMIEVSVSAQNANSKIISIILDMTPTDELSLGENTINLENGSQKTVQFTAPEDGFYIFAGSDNLRYYADDISDNHIVTCDSGKQFFIMKDKTVFLKVNGNNNTSTINVQKGDPIPNSTTLYVGGSNRAIVEAGESKWYTFTAQNDGVYNFYSSDNDGDPAAWLYEDVAVANINSSYDYNGNTYYYSVGDDDTAESGNFRITCNLKAGQKIYLETSHYSHSNTIQYTVNVTFAPDYSGKE